MPFDKDFHRLNEAYIPKPNSSTPNKVNHNTPSTVTDVKKSSAATSGYGLDVKGQLSDKGMAGNTPVDVEGYPEEDAEAPSHDQLIKQLEGVLSGLKKHINKAKHEQKDK
jgi:hypothetical protein